jgi:hypothetical protein
MVEACLICGANTCDVAAHVWYYHVPLNYCWCGVGMWDLVSTYPRDTDPDINTVFRNHCADHGGYFVHYLECRLGVSRG